MARVKSSKPIGKKQSKVIVNLHRKPNMKQSPLNDDQFDTAEVKRKWYEDTLTKFSEDPREFVQLSETDIQKLKDEAKKILENETLHYNNRNSKNSGKSSFEWLRTIMAKGTVSDRIAAYTVLIQNSPIHNLATIRNLVNMVKVGKKKECIMIIETLTELFLTDLLLPDKKLRVFESFPLTLLTELSSGNRTSRNTRLIHWYFEDQLKELYRAFIQALQTAAHDTVESNKEKAISAMYKLLAGNPEQESLLLTCIVNKLGDPSQKVSSKTIYCLTRLLQTHPNMKFVVMAEIEKLLFRDKECLPADIEVQEENNSTYMAPELDIENTDELSNMNRPNVSPRAQYYGICFLSQFLLSREDVALAVNLIKLYFSFFKACLKKGDVDTRLMSALLMGVNRAYPYAKDQVLEIDEHVETIYKVVHIASFNVGLQALCLLYQVADYTSAVSDRFYSVLYKKLLDPQLSASSHQAMFLGLIYRALKKDVSDNRVRAFVKRLLQVCFYSPVPLVCGVMYMISQLMHNNKALQAFTMKASSFIEEENVDEDYIGEHYEDVKTEESGDMGTPLNEPKEDHVEEKPVASWFHYRNLQGKSRKPVRVLSQYDPHQRNPIFAGGEFCAYTELLELSRHNHPTIALFSAKMLRGETISYSGDPLQDFTLARFLDRFVFKNPKKTVTYEEKPNMKFSRKWTYQPTGIKSMAVNSAGYLNCDESAIPVDELFMYRYLVRKQAAKSKVKGDESDGDSVASDEFEEMLDNLMGGKEKEIDYADEVGDKLPSSKDEDVDSDEVSEEGEEDEDDGSDIDDDSAEDLVFDDDGEEDEHIEFDINNLPDDDDDDDDYLNIGNKFKPKQNKDKKKDLKGGIDRSMFASADEFAEMLQDTGDTNLKLGGLASMSNKDNAGVKQLKWEMKRDHWVKGAQRGKRKGWDKSSSRPPKKFKR